MLSCCLQSFAHIHVRTHSLDSYDVTSFVEHHPGGKELLLTAAGLDLGHFFETYTVHLQNNKAKAKGCVSHDVVHELRYSDDNRDSVILLVFDCLYE